MAGQVPQHLFCVMNGSVRVSISSSDGQQFLLALLYSGYWFGEAAVTQSKSQVMEIWAETDAEVLLLPVAAVRTVARDYPVVYQRLFEELMRRSQLMYQLLAGMLFYSLKARIAGRILFLLRDHGVSEPDGLTLDVKLSQVDFARMSMGSRQRVNKAFREWMHDGVIERRGDRYIIKDVAALEKSLKIEG